MQRILIVDGQGGKIGRTLVERLTEKLAALSPDKALCEITVVGTNAMAAANMMKGAPGIRGATGENAVAVCARKADIIAGPIGIVLADAMLGEITPAMACALSSADAVRVLIPMNRTQCENIIVGVKELSLGAMLDEAADTIVGMCVKEEEAE